MMDPPADEGQVTPPWLLGAIELETAQRAKAPLDFFKLVATMPFHTVALALKKFPDMRRQYLSELSDACPPSGQPKPSCQPSLYHLDPWVPYWNMRYFDSGVHSCHCCSERRIPFLGTAAHILPSLEHAVMTPPPPPLRRGRPLLLEHAQGVEDRRHVSW